MRADYSIQRRILASGAVLLLIVGLFLFWMVRWSAQRAAMSSRLGETGEVLLPSRITRERSSSRRAEGGSCRCCRA